MSAYFASPLLVFLSESMIIFSLGQAPLRFLHSSYGNSVISEIIRKEIRGIEGVLSIVDVEVSHDNSYAKVYYSVLGSEEQVAKDKEIIEKNTGKVRYEIGKRIRLRVTPEIKFVYSDGLEQGSRVLDLINKISKGEIK